MSNTINSVSPSIRDWLLSKNLILSDTILNAGLSALGSGLGLPAQTETLPNAVQASPDIMEMGNHYRDLNLLNNPYVSENEYEVIDINSFNIVNIGNLPPGSSPAEYMQNIGSKVENSEFNKQANKGREELLKNKYYDEDYITNVDITTKFVSSNGGVYDYKSLLLSRSVDTLLNSINLGGIAQQTNNNFLPNTPLEDIANVEIVKHFGYKAAFGATQNTLGRLNANPLSLLMGNDIIVPNYQITVPKGELGSGLDFIGKVLGFETPKSYLDQSSSIFASETPGTTNIDRLNSMVLNTGKGQVVSLIQNLSQNKFKPNITDGRKREGITKGDTGIDGNLYLFDDGQGGIVNLLDASPNSKSGLMTLNDLTSNVESEFETEYGKITSSNDENFNSSFDDLVTKDRFYSGEDNSVTKFTWSDNLNNIGEELGVYSRNEMKNPKSLLYKTQALFNSNKLRNLITAEGDIVGNSEIQTPVVVGGVNYISKGSQVKSQAGLEGNVSSPNEVFCRVWTTFDRYNQVQNLQKSEGLNSNVGLRFGNNAKFSVLDDNGFPKIAPYITDNPTADNPKRFMLSLENLAWANNVNDLPESEKGPGDPYTGTKGRIMWFPPYDLNFTDNSSVNWDSTNFIGRGEPVYTYNNTERSGTIGFKIIIDYASYMNEMKTYNMDDDIYASIASGCYDFDLESIKELSKNEIDLIEVANNVKPQEIIGNPDGIAPTPFKIYFPNDVSTISNNYEDGIIDVNEITYSEGYTFTGCKGSGGPARANSNCPCAQANRTDFGLNVLPYTLPETDNDPMGEHFPNGWLGSQMIPKLAEYVVKYCPSCRINISGYASADGRTDSNQKLSLDRANNVKILIEQELLNANDPLGGKRFGSKPIGKGATNVQSCPKIADFKCAERDKILDVDVECKKLSRYVEISFEKDPELDAQIIEANKVMIENENLKNLSTNIKSRFFNESLYFEKLRQEDKIVYDRISEKIKYFHPAFHSITPEGFNARLTFLKQCTRQGDIKSDVSSNPKNLAFGLAPVCILRVGDFYHTKIIIDNLDLSFEPLVWDLNPEGVGVQPMIANISISFKFIGGSSLQGPINKLQNALSFNYFANTGIYDSRADYIKLSSAPDSSAEYIKGVSPMNEEALRNYIKESEKGGIGNNTIKPDINQTDVADNANSKQ